MIDNEILNEQRYLINSKNTKMKYMDETKKKILELDRTMEIEQETTEKESFKYNEIISVLEEEKQNLEKILQDEIEKYNIFSVFSLYETYIYLYFL